MEQILQNHHFTLAIDPPAEGYLSSRFDWSGKITQVHFNGKPIAGQELPNQISNTEGLGFYNEFGIDNPVGFDEIPQGDWFHKIGVGLLRKSGSVYDFKQTYEIKPATFTFQSTYDHIKITCHSENYNGYAYQLTKEIQLADDGFYIIYHLRNTGLKKIETTEYIHNFLNINGAEIGPAYHLSFPFELHTNVFGETVNPEQVVGFSPREIGFTGHPTEPFFFSNLSGNQLVQASWQMENHQQKIRISESGDFQTKSINLWGMGHVISPELFKEINLPPGHTTSWKRTYQIVEL